MKERKPQVSSSAQSLTICRDSCKAFRFLLAVRSCVHYGWATSTGSDTLNRTEDDSKIVNQAKRRLMVVLQVTEPQAHWLLQRAAMNKRRTRKDIAELLLIFPEEDCREWLAPVLSNLPAAADLPTYCCKHLGVTQVLIFQWLAI